MPLRLRNRPPAPATAPSPAEGPAPPAQPEGFFANLRRPENLVRLGGSLLGGAALTAGLASFIGPAAPFVGFGLAGAGSEFGAEKVEQFRGLRKKVNPLQVATQGALNAVPMGKLGVASGIAKGAMLGGGAEMASRYAETGEVAPPSGRALLTGAVLGGGAGAVSRFMRPRKVPTSSTPVTEGRAPVSGDANLMRAKVDRARELSAEIGDHVSPWNVPQAESFVRSRALDTIRENARNLRFRQPALPVEGALDIAAGPPPRLRAQLPSNVPPTSFERPEVNPSLSRPLLPSGLDVSPPGITPTPFRAPEPAPSPSVPPNIETMTSAEAAALAPEKLLALLRQREARTTIPTEGAAAATNKVREMLRAANGGGQPSQAEVIDNLNRRLGIERRQPGVQLPPTAVEQRVGERRTSALAPAEGAPAPNMARPGPVEHGPVNPTPSAPDATGLQQVDARAVKLDPKTYQFKGGGDKYGVTDRLQKVQQWDPLAGSASPVVLHQKTNGDLFVVDGHQRVALAKRLMDQNRPVPPLSAIVLKESEGVTAPQARRIGAMLNLQQGTGSALDVAKVLREQPLTSTERARIPQDQTSGVRLRTGEDLSKLDDDAFNKVVAGQVSTNPARNEQFGAVVGRLVPKGPEQVSALQELAKAEPATGYEADQFVKAQLAAGFERGTQTNLFGTEEVATSLAKPISQVMAAARRVLTSEKSALGNAVRNEARLTEKGNVMNKAANVAGLEQAGALDTLLDKYGHTAGPVRDALKESAGAVHRGELSPSAASTKVLTALEGELRRLREPGAAGVPAGRAEPPALVPAPAAPQAIAEETAAGTRKIARGDYGQAESMPPAAAAPAESIPSARPGAAPVPNISGATAEFTTFRQDGTPEYLVHGGPNDRSTLSADELQKQGIDVPPTPAAPAAGATKAVPANVKAFLTRQLGYTPEQVDALGFDEAIRAGREKIPAPAPTATPTEAEQILEQMRSLTSKPAPPIAEVPFALKAGEAAKTPPVEQPTLLTEAAAGVQTSAEAARRTIRGTGESPREMGTNPKAAEEFDKLIDAGQVDDAEQLLSQQIENRIKTTFKHGVGPKEPDGGTTLGSGFGALQPIFDKHPELAARVIRSALGGAVGAYLDPEHKGRGAILGAVAGANALELTRAIANSELLHTTGVAPVRVARGPGDLNVFEMIGGTPERNIPAQFERVRPAYLKFQKTLRDEYARTGKQIPTDRVRAIRNNIVGPALRQIRQDAVKMKAAGEIWKAKYAQAYADHLSGGLTTGQRNVNTLFKGHLRPDFIERAVGGTTYRVLTGWALDTAIQNATQPAMALAHVPAADMMRGLQELATPEGRAFVNDVLLPLERPTDVIESTLGPFGQKVQAVGKKIDPQVFLRKTDDWNRKWVYLSARRYAERQGLAPAAADTFGQQVMRKTQGEPGALGTNPFHRGPIGGSLRPFMKYPAIFTEHLADVVKSATTGQNLPGAARFAGAVGGAILLGNLMGVDMQDILLSGGRPLGLDISHPEASAGQVASGQPFVAVRALKDLAAHMTGTADHDIAAFNSLPAFLGSDLGPLLMSRYPTKVANFFLSQRTPDNALVTPGSGGKIRDVTTGREAILNLAGLRTTRQTARREALTSYYEEAGKGLQDYNAQRRQAYDELGRGLDSGDVDAVRHAAATIGDPTAIRQFLVRRTQLPEERFNRTLPPALRRAMQGRLAAVQETAVKP